MKNQREVREAIALDARAAVKLVLPGGALLFHLPAARELLVLREPWAPQPVPPSRASVAPPSTMVRLEYLDPANKVLRGFQFLTLQAFLAVLEPYADGVQQ